MVKRSVFRVSERAPAAHKSDRAPGPNGSAARDPECVVCMLLLIAGS